MTSHSATRDQTAIDGEDSAFGHREDSAFGHRDDGRDDDELLDEGPVGDDADRVDSPATAGAPEGNAAVRIDRLERRVAALESELDAVRGLLGGVEAVDETVEKRASIALAKVEALEREVATADPGVVRERLAAPTDPEARPGNATPTERAATSSPDSSSRPSADGPSSVSSSPTDSDDDGSDDDGSDDDGLAARLRGALR